MPERYHHLVLHGVRHILDTLCFSWLRCFLRSYMQQELLEPKQVDRAHIFNIFFFSKLIKRQDGELAQREALKLT